MGSLFRQLNLFKSTWLSYSRLRVVHNDMTQAVRTINSINPCNGTRNFSALTSRVNSDNHVLNTSRQPEDDFNQVRHYKVKDILHLRCKGCYFVRRHERLFVECKLKGRHKQMQKMPKWKLYKEDYSKGDVVRAAFWNYHHKSYYKLGDSSVEKFDWIGDKIGKTL